MASTIAIPPRPPNLRKKRNAHPGRVDQARAKRSSEEVQKAKADKAAKKQEASERRDASVKKAAAIELAKEVKDLGSELTANHPPPNTTQKVLRTRPEKATTTVTEFDAGAAAGVVDPVSDGPGSSDEYEPPAGKEDEDERILDPSDDEVAPPPKPAPRKPHKGAAPESVRVSVEAQRALLAESGAKGKAKRKEPPHSRASPQKKSKSKAQALGGLRDEYKRSRGRTPDVSNASKRSKSAGSAISVDRREEQYTDGDDDVGMPPESEYNDSSEGLDSLAGIVDTDAPGLVPLKKSVGIKKKNLTLEDLPHDIRSQFNSKFKPKFLQQLESQPAWTGIDSWKDVAPIWDKLFPKYTLAECRDLQPVVVKLTEAKLSRWRHDFAIAATESLGRLLDAWDLETPDDRGSAVQSLLERQPDSTARVFYYRQYYAEPVEDAEADPERSEAEPVVAPMGLFGGHLIIESFASHYKSVHPRGVTVQQIIKPGWVSPDGALVYSVLAAQRALTYSKTGKLIVPAQRLGEFSRTNWGDRSVSVGGEMVDVKTTSDVARHVKKLTEKQWGRILEAAIVAAQPSHKTSKVSSNVIDLEDVEVDAGDADAILIDNDSD
ncbi:hypothetical protein B0H14DRAFT_3894451 [Mycena olivaceomarginata]|nr:hypothetical protein B0H14DRAFT_3894451 [Mycena olivaceomarginata]